jgi:hypothetical protein
MSTLVRIRKSSGSAVVSEPLRTTANAVAWPPAWHHQPRRRGCWISRTPQQGAALTEHEPVTASRAAGNGRLGSWRRDLLDPVNLSLVEANAACAGHAS